MAARLAAARDDVRGIDAQAEWLTEEVPAAILAGDGIPPRPPLPRRTGLRARLGT
jgi:hypothetical protein